MVCPETFKTEYVMVGKALTGFEDWSWNLIILSASLICFSGHYTLRNTLKFIRVLSGNWIWAMMLRILDINI